VKKKRARDASRQKENPSRARVASDAGRALPRTNLWIVAALVLATLVAYAPAFSAPFVMDDETAIAETLSGGQIPAGSPVAGRPVASATLAINYSVNNALGVDQRPDPDGPRKTVGYRLLNILFHLCTGALLFGVLRRAMRERTVPDDWRAIADPIGGIACALWLLHPIQTEAINYVVQRTELLASLFYVAVLYSSIRAWDAESNGARLRWYALAIASCVLGMGSKEIVISAPLAVVLYDRAFRLPSWNAVLKPGGGRGWFYGALIAACVLPFVLMSVGARGNTAGFDTPMKWYDYFYSQGWAVAQYLRLIAWPNALSIDYGEQAIRGAKVLPGLTVLAVLASGTIVAWMRPARWGWLAFLGSMFFILLAPSSSIVPIRTEIAAERRVYLALIVVVVAAVIGAEWLRRRFGARISGRQLGYGACVIAVTLTMLTAARSHTYVSPEKLWSGAIREVPANARAYVNLGTALVDQGPSRYAEAESVFLQAIGRDTTCQSGCAQLARLLLLRGQLPKAAELLERALTHDSADVGGERRLSRIYMRLGRFDLAVPHLEHLATARRAEQQLVVLAVAYYAAQRQRDAITAFDRAMQLYPDNLTIRKLGATLYAAARGPDALPHLQELALSLTKDWE
jgi:Flp pilus assembly protein TadD